MRSAALLLLAALPVSGEFLRFDVAFEDTGCASCIESLERRLGRVRGVERVEVDAARGVAVLHLAAENRVRLTPLLSRITQDGTKILRTEVVVRGTVETVSPEVLFQPSGLNRTYRVNLKPGVSQAALEPGRLYQIKGVVSQAEPGAKPVLEAESVTREGAGE